MTWGLIFDAMCVIIALTGMASFKAKLPVLQELFAKNHKGAFGPPSRARDKSSCILYLEKSPTGDSLIIGEVTR